MLMIKTIPLPFLKVTPIYIHGHDYNYDVYLIFYQFNKALQGIQ